MSKRVTSRGKLMVLKALETLPPVRKSTRKRKCRQQIDFEFTPLHTSTPHKKRLVLFLHCTILLLIKIFQINQ